MSDSDLRQALLGTWRLIGLKPPNLGEIPQGYLVYTPDDRVFVQFATRTKRSWPGSDVLDMTLHQAIVALGFFAYCGTFEVRDGQVIHHREFGIFPSLSGNVETRLVVLDGDRLVLSNSQGTFQNEFQRVRSGEPR